MKLASLLKEIQISETPDTMHLPSGDIAYWKSDSVYTFLSYYDKVDHAEYWIAYSPDKDEIFCENKEIVNEIYNIRKYIPTIEKRAKTDNYQSMLHDPSEEGMEYNFKEIKEEPNHSNLIDFLVMLRRADNARGRYGTENGIGLDGRVFDDSEGRFIFSFWNYKVFDNDKYIKKFVDFLKFTGFKRSKVYIESPAPDDSDETDIFSFNDYFSSYIHRRTNPEADVKLKAARELHIKKAILDKAVVNAIESNPRNRNELYANLEKQLNMPIAKIRSVFNNIPLDKLVVKEIREMNKNTSTKLIDMLVENKLSEMPVTKYKTIGFDKKGHSFSDKRDRDLVTHPTHIKKVEDFFKKTDEDFELYFVNKQGARSYAETGKVDYKFLIDKLKLTPEEIGDINDDAISIFYVGNTAAEKIPLTAWTIAHRFGHSINKEYHFQELTKFIDNVFENVLESYNVLKPTRRGWGDSDEDWKNSRMYEIAKAKLFNQLGTMRSAREGKIKRYFEFYYELFAQYLNTGQIKFNKLPATLTIGHGAYGRKLTASTRTVKDVNEYLEMIERDFEFYANDALGSIVGNIYVM